MLSLRIFLLICFLNYGFTEKRILLSDPSSIQHQLDHLQAMVTSQQTTIAALESKMNSLQSTITSNNGTIAFTARLTHSIQAGEQQAIEYNEVLTNIGNGYDPRHGHFVAPVPGTYVFAFSMVSPVSTYLHLDIVKNGDILLRTFSDPAGYTMGSQVAVTELAVGDMVWIRHSVDKTADTVFGTIAGEFYNSFSGFLLR